MCGGQGFVKAGIECPSCGGTGRLPDRNDKEYYRWHFMIDLRKVWNWLKKLIEK
jgi:hypothetical protein